MVKKVISKLWYARYQFAKYVIVGTSGFVLDMATLIYFKEHLGMMPVMAVVVNQMIVLTYNFSLNKWWSFKNKEIPHKQLVRYLTLAGFNYAFSVLTMWVFADLLGQDYRIVRLLTVMLMVLWNFLLYKYWVYRPEEVGEDE